MSEFLISDIYDKFCWVEALKAHHFCWNHSAIAMGQPMSLMTAASKTWSYVMNAACPGRRGIAVYDVRMLIWIEARGSNLLSCFVDISPR